jgi:midasin
MSTLEVGELAVASFGQKGNMKILQDFNTPFSSDVGIKVGIHSLLANCSSLGLKFNHDAFYIQMISQFSFKQDNTIADEPMVDLLQCLTCMLDDVAKSAARPTGHQLQQLVLIVADGRFHEKV